MAAAAAAKSPALLLGSILPDLPYHAKFGAQVVRHLAGKEYLASEWGDILHTRGTGQLALALLRHLVRSKASPEEHQQVLALIAGYLCHYSLDRVVHPRINALVDQHRADAQVPPTVLHARLERFQNLLFHEDETGHDILATPFARRLVGAMDGAGLWRPQLSPPLWSAIRAATLEAHGRAPRNREVSDWLWGTTAYGTLMSTPFARVEQIRGDREQVRRQHYQGPEVDLATPLEQGVEASLQAWQAAEAALAAERLSPDVRRTFLRQVPDVDLATGA